MKSIKKFFKEHNLAIIIITIFIFSLGGGIIGGIATGAYLADPSFSFLPFGNFDFSAGKYAGQGLVINNAKNVTVEQDIKIDETINSGRSSLIGIYKKKPAPASLNNVFSLDNFYRINEPSGQGFVITSDGWIATSLAAVKNYDDYVVITEDKKIYEIDKMVADSSTKFNFIHVRARDLLVRKLAASEEIESGNLVVGVTWLGVSFVSSVAALGGSASLVESSDSFSQKIILQDKLPAEFKGATIFNLAGDALGLVNDSGEIEPISHLNGAIKSLFKNKTVARPSLGINYIDLTKLIEATGSSNLWQRGVIIYKDQKAVAVRKNSPAEASGLKEGDVITLVDGLELNKNNNLTDIIQNHLVGETVNLVISRQGEEKEIKIVLSEQK